MPAPLEHGAQPQGRDAQRRQVVELRRDTAQRAALRAVGARPRPRVPPPRTRPRRVEVSPIEQRALVLPPIAEAVGEEEVDDSSRQWIGDGWKRSRRGRTSSSQRISGRRPARTESAKDIVVGPPRAVGRAATETLRGRAPPARLVNIAAIARSVDSAPRGASSERRRLRPAGTNG
jgi:hypothetical protein